MLHCICRLTAVVHMAHDMHAVCVLPDACFPGTCDYFPPKLRTLLAWAALFRSGGTYRNYLAFVKTGCMIVGASTEVCTLWYACCLSTCGSLQVFGNPVLTKAKASVDKSQLFKKREPLWLQRRVTLLVPQFALALPWVTYLGRGTVERLIQLGESRAEFKLLSLLCLLTYAFLLRMPSEAIPVTAGTGECCLSRDGDVLVLKLQKRKNKREGSRLVRGCWCNESRTTCPVHVLSPLLVTCKRGTRLFPGITAAGALSGLRQMLNWLGVPRACEYRTHDLRRGHAKDLQLSGIWLMSHGAESPSPYCFRVKGLRCGKFLRQENGAHLLSCFTWTCTS